MPEQSYQDRGSDRTAPDCIRDAGHFRRFGEDIDHIRKLRVRHLGIVDDRNHGAVGLGVKRRRVLIDRNDDVGGAGDGRQRLVPGRRTHARREFRQ